MNNLTEAQAKFVELEKQKEKVKQYFNDLEAAAEELVNEHGVDFMFQDPEGTVYKLVIPTGRFVNYPRYGYQRTRRLDEKRGDLSLKDAEKAGFMIERK